MSEMIQLTIAPKEVLVVSRAFHGIARLIAALREAGCRVELATTSSEAIARAAVLNPEVVVIEVRQALAMVARDVRNDRALLRRQTHEVCVHHEVVRVLVVPFVTHEVAHVVEQRSGDEKDLIARPEPVARR